MKRETTTLPLFMMTVLCIVWSDERVRAVDFSQMTPAHSTHSMIQLSIQRYPMSSDETSQVSEPGHRESQKHLSLNLSQTALLLVDIWKMHEEHPDDGWLDKKHANITHKIVPLLAVARHHRLKIIHLPHRQEIADEATPLPGELVCNPKEPDDSQQELLAWLQEHQVTTLLYAGYTSNLCVLYRPVGILAMRALGHQTILIRECTLAFVPKNSTPQDEYARLKQVEPLWGITTTLNDVQHALQRSETPRSYGVLEEHTEGKKREQEKREEDLITR